MAHAYIITGRTGVDLQTAAKEYIEPNSIVIPLEHHQKPRGTAIGIFVDDIRELQTALRTQNKQRICVLCYDAALLTQQAQNAFLKLLEEPRDNVQIILATPEPQKLLATVRSRCQLIEVSSVAGAIDIPTDKKAIIEYFAGGVTDEKQRLLSDEHYFNERRQVFERAKQLVVGSIEDKISVITSLKDNRTEAIEVVDAALTIVQYQLKRNPIVQLHSQLNLLYETRENLEKNANVRLHLFRAVI